MNKMHNSKRKNKASAVYFIRGRFYLLYFLPAALGFVFFYVLPFLISLYFIFFEPDGAEGMKKINGIAAAFSNSAFILALKNTFLLLLLFIPAITFVSIAVSYLIFKIGQKFAKTGRALLSVVLIPYIIPSVAVVTLWFFVFDGSGVLNFILRSFSGNGFDFENGILALFALMLVFLWKYTGINIVIMTAAFSFIPKETVENARIDGCNEKKLFFAIIFPQTKKPFYFTILLSVMGIFNLSDEIYAIWGSYPPQTLYTIHNFMTNTVLKMEYYKSITAAVVFSVFVILCAALYIVMEKRWDG